MRPDHTGCTCFDETVRRCPVHGNRLDEFDKVAWFDVCKKVQPELTETAFERLWQDFLEMKRKLMRH